MQVALFLASCLATVTATAITITEWDFEADPLGVGVAENWASVQHRPKLQRTLTSPGAWEAQGVGNETALEHHQYQGVGWYRKSLGAPPTVGDGGSVWLWIGGAPGGVMRSANVYANGVHCGRHVGYIEPLEIELTAAVLLNRTDLVIAVAVDSRWNRTEDPLWGAGSGWNPGAVGAGGWGGDGYSFGGYGGIIGNALVVVRQRAWIADSVHTSCKNSGRVGGDWRCVVAFSLVGDLHPADQVSLTVCEWSSAATSTAAACAPGNATVVGGSAAARFAISVEIPAAKVWTPGTRAALADLYVANLTLLSGGGAGSTQLDLVSTRFGVRSLTTDGARIIFNGDPLFLRGYGDDANYGFTLAPPMDKSYYLGQLRGMKELGYNFVRFHTHSMPDVFHEAADELGFLCDAEFAMSYAFPDPFGSPLNQAVRDTFNRSFTSIVFRRSHHPSMFAYVLSNEIQFAGTVVAEFEQLYHFAKQHDPERPCWFGDGSTVTSGMNVTALGCRNGAEAGNEHCFMDVWVAASSHLVGRTSSFRPQGA